MNTRMSTGVDTAQHNDTMNRGVDTHSYEDEHGTYGSVNRRVNSSMEDLPEGAVVNILSLVHTVRV